MTSHNVEENVLKYENFINDVLKEDLKRIETHLNHVNTQLTDLCQQRDSLIVLTNKEIHPDGFKTQVNLGGNFFMEARVPGTSTVLINIGLDYYLEYPLEEAKTYLNMLIKAYEKKSKELCTKALETKAHIKLILMSIIDLINMKNVS